MSLVLDGSQPQIQVKTHGIVREMGLNNDAVFLFTDENFIGVVQKSFGRDCSSDKGIFWDVALVQYVFTNTDLTENDPRISLVNRCIFGEKTLKGMRKELFDWFAELDTKAGWDTVFHPQSKAKRFGTFDLPKV